MPEIEQVVSGNEEIVNIHSIALQITAADKTIVNYKSFDIAQNESVIINLPNVSNEILNRVLGDNASKILGNLTCNGIVILVNQVNITARKFGTLAAPGTIVAGSIYLKRTTGDVDILWMQWVKYKS